MYLAAAIVFAISLSILLSDSHSMAAEALRPLFLQSGEELDSLLPELLNLSHQLNGQHCQSLQSSTVSCMYFE